MPGKWIEHIPAACQGCGACVAECPQDAITLDAMSDDAIMAQIEAALAEEPEKKVIMFTCAYCSYWAADNAGIFKMQYRPTRGSLGFNVVLGWLGSTLSVLLSLVLLVSS
ncbi:4Fe-4S binding protein [Vulcanisaeta distributa]|uniref:4Fe-4S binding protein n=1 Tax=Vulcanisaeta distributa TaxID=164451 RepID=UPI001FB3769F|nr:4Fe-4S binding protein [Vulcanisaeta distributa]